MMQGTNARRVNPASSVGCRSDQRPFTLAIIVTRWTARQRTAAMTNHAILRRAWIVFIRSMYAPNFVTAAIFSLLYVYRS